MGLELSSQAERSQSSDNDSNPTSTPSSSVAANDTNSHQMTHVEDKQTEQTGLGPVHGMWQPTSKYPDANPSPSAQTLFEDYASTPPIDVPRPRADGEGYWAVDNVYLENGTFHNGHNGMYEDKHLEEFLQNRRPSIKFSPELTLDSGERHSLEEPLPKLAIDSKPIDRVALKELERYPPRSATLYRTHSEADIRDYDPVTGQRLREPQSAFDAPEDFSKITPIELNGRIHTPAHAPKLDPLNFEEATSLTSDITISPIQEEARTPPENMELLTSPISAFPPFAFPTSYEDSSAWPKPRRRTSTRTNSFAPERATSMRSTRRSTTRRSTSSPMSPASSFLSRFAPTTHSERPPSPDSEGQVIGEYVLGKQLGYGGFSVVKEAFTIEGDTKIVRAAKIVRKQLDGITSEAENDRLQAEFEHEVQIWRHLGHRNILPLIEVYDTSFATFCFTKRNLGGTLFDKIRSNRQGLSSELARRYAYQLASAIRYLHEDVHIVHRDIKLENCLIDTSDPDTARDGGNLLLCDFGLAEFVANDLRSDSPNPYPTPPPHSITTTPTSNFSTDDHHHHHHQDPPYPAAHPATITTTNNGHQPPYQPPSSEAAHSIAGSLQYASPELILSPAGFISPVVDIWAFGVVIYAMLVGDLPFQHVFQPRVQMMILAGEWDVRALEGCRAVRGEGGTMRGVNGVGGGIDGVGGAGRGVGKGAGDKEDVLEFVQGCLEMRSECRWDIGDVLGGRWLRGMQEILEEREGGFKL